MVALAVVLAGCGSGPGRDAPAPAQPTVTEAAATTAAAGRPTPSPQPSAPGGSVTSSPPVEPGLDSVVSTAVADLAARLAVPADTIATRAARSVTWPDRGLGCPQPGMLYLQVPVDGTLVELEVGGTVYRYHSGGGRGPFLCQTPG